MKLRLRRPALILPPLERRNVRVVALDGMAIGLMSATASFVSVMAIRLGASALWVSLLSSLPAAIALVMTIPWSEFVSRQSRPERIFAFSRLAVHVVYPLIAIVPFFLPHELAARAIVIIWSLSAFPSSLSNMMFTLVMGHAVSPEHRSILMSRRWIVLGLAKLLMLPLISRLMDGLPFPGGYQAAFGLNALIAALALYLGLRIEVPGQAHPQASARGPLVTRLREEWGSVARETPFLVFIGGRAVLNLGLSLVAAIVPIYWVDHLQASDTWVGYFNAMLSGATLLSYFLWVYIKRRYGTRWTLVPTVVAMAFYPALLTLARAPAGALPFIAIEGVAEAGVNLAFFDALLEASPPDKEARFVAINMTAVNLVGVVGPPLGAALLGVIGIRWVMAIGSLVALLGAAVFAFVRPRPKSVSRPEAA